MSATLEYNELLQRYEQSQQQNAALQIQLLQLQQQLAQLQKMIFGSRHERFVPNNNPAQLSLGITSDAVAMGGREW